MKLRNKKTGEIIDVYKGQILLHYSQGKKTIQFKSIEELEEWGDYEEPEKFWFIDFSGEVKEFEMLGFEWQGWMKEIGNYFGTKEEAEKAVEKLKALTRIQNKGFKFCGHDDRDIGQLGDIVIYAEMPTFEYDDDSTRDGLDLLFGGEDE